MIQSRFQENAEQKQHNNELKYITKLLIHNDYELLRTLDQSIINRYKSGATMQIPYAFAISNILVQLEKILHFLNIRNFVTP